MTFFSHKQERAQFASESRINFLVWPRTDVDRITCSIFSKWKGDERSFHNLKDFTISSSEYQHHLNEKCDKTTKGKKRLECTIQLLRWDN